MPETTNTIICPKCKEPISVEEALAHRLREQIVQEERVKAEKSAEEAASIQLITLKEELQLKNQKLEETEKAELDLRHKANLLEEEKRTFELDKQRAIDSALEEVRQKAVSEETEKFRLKEREYQKQLDDMKSALDVAQSKAASSQQLQGEVQELDLEEQLRDTFLNDMIEPVGKGVKGADIKQIVKTARGNVCGIILWESKRTKDWGGDWIDKIKTDMLASGANICVIVSRILPKDSTSDLFIKDKVVICKPSLTLTVAQMLRDKLIEVARERYVAENRGEKADILYNFVTSHEFRNQIEVIAEIYNNTHMQISRERVAYEKLWKIRENDAQKLIKATASIVGTIQGTVGSTIPIKGLELLELENGDSSNGQTV